MFFQDTFQFGHQKIPFRTSSLRHREKFRHDEHIFHTCQRKEPLTEGMAFGLLCVAERGEALFDERTRIGGDFEAVGIGRRFHVESRHGKEIGTAGMKARPTK